MQHRVGLCLEPQINIQATFLNASCKFQLENEFLAREPYAGQFLLGPCDYRKGFGAFLEDVGPDLVQLWIQPQ